MVWGKHMILFISSRNDVSLLLVVPHIPSLIGPMSNVWSCSIIGLVLLLLWLSVPTYSMYVCMCVCM